MADRPYRAGVAAAVTLTVLSRWGWVAATRTRGYDDGVYLASVDALAAGGAPFRDVYSSQGPLFLPLLRLADALGPGRWAPRLAPLAAGVVVVLVVAALARRAADPAAGAVAAALAATSGALLLTSSSLESDAIAAAFGSLAVLAAAREGAARAVLLVGLAAGAALSVKSLLAVPPVLAAGYLVAGRLGWRAALRVGAVAVAVGLALAVAWGLGDVWDQSIGLHLDARDAIDVGGNLRTVRRLVWHDDRLLVLAAVLAVAAALASRYRTVRNPHHGAPRTHGGTVERATWVWLGAAAAVLLLDAPLQVQHLTVLVTPMAVLVAIHRPPLPLLALVTALVLPGQAHRTAWRVSPARPDAAEVVVADLLRDLRPTGAEILSDDPGLAWLADRTIPGPLVDPSFVRIRAGHLDADEVIDASATREVCAVVFWTGRFDSIPGFGGAQLDGYRLALADGSHRLYLKDGCTT